MLRRFRPRLTFANVVSVIALFVALGGGAYAAFHLPKNSVTSRNIKNGQVKTPDLASGAVNGGKIAQNSVASGQIVNGQVQSSDLAKPDFQSAGLVNDPASSCAGITDQWANEAADGTVGYYRDVQGRVYLEGVAERCGNPASGNTIFVLPAGLKSIDPFTGFPIIDISGAPKALAIDSSGDVSIGSSVAGQRFSLDGVSFRCGPAGQNGCP